MRIFVAFTILLLVLAVAMAVAAQFRSDSASSRVEDPVWEAVDLIDSTTESEREEPGSHFEGLKKQLKMASQSILFICSSIPALIKYVPPVGPARRKGWRRHEYF